MTPLEQARMDQAIGLALLEVMPTNWRGLLLTARLIEGSGPGWSLRLSIEPHPHASGVAFVSDALESRIAELFAAHRKAATGMVEVRYIVDAANPASPSVISELEYSDD